MKFTVITLFPELFPGTLGVSVPVKSLNNKWQLEVCNLKDYGKGVHKQVDDEVYGGGSGMLIRPDILGNALDDCIARSNNPYVLLTSPRGVVYEQNSANFFASSVNDIIIICGRFEGVDYRIVEYYKMLEVSIGKFVLFGGEVVAMCIMESIVRLIDGVCGNDNSLKEESYASGTKFENLMEYPQYTRPKVWNNIEVPSVLLSGNHKKIQDWRLQMAVSMTEFYNNTDLFKKK